MAKHKVKPHKSGGSRGGSFMSRLVPSGNSVVIGGVVGALQPVAGAASARFLGSLLPSIPAWGHGLIGAFAEHAIGCATPWSDKITIAAVSAASAQASQAFGLPSMIIPPAGVPAVNDYMDYIGDRAGVRRLPAPTNVVAFPLQGGNRMIGMHDFARGTHHRTRRFAA